MQESLFPALRDALDDRFSELTDAELESVFETAFGEGVTPAEYEEFFSGLTRSFSSIAKDVGRFAQQAAPVAATAAQGALGGAAAGSRFGPYGALVGALAGGAGSALQTHGTGAARNVGSVLSGAVSTAGALGGGGLAQAAGGLLAGAGGRARGPATGQLLGLLQRPEAAQALRHLFGGSNTPVPVGKAGTPVPANAFAGLLASLAREAEAEAERWDDTDSVPAFLVGPTGELIADPADPDQRALRLLLLLSGAPAEAEPESDDRSDSDGDSDDADDDSVGFAGEAFDDEYLEADYFDVLDIDYEEVQLLDDLPDRYASTGGFRWGT